MNDRKSLSVEGITSASTQLNNISEQITDVCSEMYTKISALSTNQAFVTLLASPGYFEEIDALNQIVPKFSEAILRFSRFLMETVVQNYEVTDSEVKTQIESNLAESLAQLTAIGAIGKSGLDYSKISTTASGANSGSFVNSDKVHKQYFEDGELQFVTREDGSVQIVKNGTVMGYTTEDALTGDAASAVADDTVESSVADNGYAQQESIEEIEAGEAAAFAAAQAQKDAAGSSTTSNGYAQQESIEEIEAGEAAAFAAAQAQKDAAGSSASSSGQFTVDPSKAFDISESGSDRGTDGKYVGDVNGFFDKPATDTTSAPPKSYQEFVGTKSDTPTSDVASNVTTTASVADHNPSNSSSSESMNSDVSNFTEGSPLRWWEIHKDDVKDTIIEKLTTVDTPGAGRP